MSVTVEQFVRALTENGVLSNDEVAPLAKSLPADSGPHLLASELVRQNKLTKFQAAAAFQGKSAALVMGNYVILDRIGAGGMGQVFQARHRRMKRVVALKLLPPSLTRSKETLSRFQREVEAAAQLEHPNIVAAYDADEANGVHFLVMQFVDGPNLQELVDRQGALSIEAAVSCIIQAAKGLEYAHRKGIVHRDIKPANLLRDADGAVRVLDMGLARFGEATISPKQPPPGDSGRIDRLLAGDTRPSDSGLTQCGQIMGTVDYIAPEQSLDTRAADHRADIYSLGCTLYFLLVGKPMYTHDNVAKRLLAHREGPTPSLRAPRKDVPQRLEAIFRKMVAKQKEERYPSMAAVVSALQSYLDEAKRPLGAPPVFEKLEASGPLPAFTEGLATLDAAAHAIGSQSSGSLPTLSAMPSGPSLQFAQPLPRPEAGSSKLLLIASGAVILVGLVFLGLIVALTFSGGDENGTLLVQLSAPGAQLEIFDASNRLVVSRQGESGTVSFAIPSGGHRVQVTKEGFLPFSTEVDVAAGEETTVDVQLAVAPAPQPAAPEPGTTPQPTAGQATSPQPAPPSAVSSDPNHRVAQWALGIGGLVEVTLEGDPSSVMLSAVSESSFTVVGLYLQGRVVADADLAMFAPLPNLATLDLTNTAVGDAGLPHLKRLTSLKQLKLAGTRITPAAAADLRAALPNCRVDR